MKLNSFLPSRQTVEKTGSMLASTQRMKYAPSILWFQGFVAGALFVTAVNLWQNYLKLRNLENPFRANEFAVAWTTAILAALLYAWIVTLIDKNEREPWRLLLLGFLWGTVISPLLAGLFTKPIAAYFNVGGEVIAPFTEELAKGTVLLLLFIMARDEFDNSLDGIIYGALVGIGFALKENSSYFINKENAATYQELFGSYQFFLRVVLKGIAGHATYTAITGLGFGLSRRAGKTWLKILIPILGITLAILAHSLWNNAAIREFLYAEYQTLYPGMSFRFPLILMVLTINGPFFVLIIGAFLSSWRKERAVIDQYLTPELDPNSTFISPKMLGTTAARFAARWRMLKSKGGAAWRQLLQLQRALIELAFCKWRGDNEIALRDRIRILRQSLDI